MYNKFRKQMNYRERLVSMNFYEITTRKTRDNNDANEMKNKCKGFALES